MVEELKFLIEAQKDYDRRETQSHWKTLSNSSHSFLRDHGQALLEAAEDAERLRFIIDQRWSLNPILASSWEVLAFDVNFRITEGFEGDDARTIIDTARSNTVDGGGV